MVLDFYEGSLFFRLVSRNKNKLRGVNNRQLLVVVIKRVNLSGNTTIITSRTTTQYTKNGPKVLKKILALQQKGSSKPLEPKWIDDFVVRESSVFWLTFLKAKSTTPNYLCGFSVTGTLKRDLGFRSTEPGFNDKEFKWTKY